MSKRIYQQWVLAATSGLLSMNAFSVAPGLYMGLMMGPAVNNGSQTTVQVMPLPTSTAPKANTGLADPKSTQFSSRIYLGYKFNTFAGFEGGFTYLSGIQYKLSNSTLIPTGGTTGRVRGVDVVGKLDYSYNDTFGLFAKFGIAALYTTTPGALNITNYTVQHEKNKKPGGPPSTQILTSGSNTYTSKLTPTYSVGASYDLNQSWVVDFTVTHLIPSGSIGTINAYELGIAYHFVDKMCGQFLC